MRSLYIYINNIQQRERELGENWSKKIIINVKKLRPRQFFFKNSPLKIKLFQISFRLLHSNTYFKNNSKRILKNFSIHRSHFWFSLKNQHLSCNIYDEYIEQYLYIYIRKIH